MAERKSLGKRIRFEVFKRDSFTCQYCGRKSPDVVLHVDHVVPLAEDGDDDIANLVTSCVDCNLGKGARKLSDESVIIKQQKQTDLLAERNEQIELLLKWKRSLLDTEKSEVDAVESFFETLTDHTFSAVGRKNIAGMVRKYGLSEVMDSILVAHTQYWGSGFAHEQELFFKKLPGVLFNRKRESEDPFHGDSCHVANMAKKHWQSWDYQGGWSAVYRIAHAGLARGITKTRLMELSRESGNVDDFEAAVDYE